MRIELRQTEDGQIHLVTRGECHGELHFRDYGAFVAFVEQWDELVKDCEDFVEACHECTKGAPPIPQPFLDAFHDCSDS